VPTCRRAGMEVWRSGGTETCVPTCIRAGTEVWRSGGVDACMPQTCGHLTLSLSFSPSPPHILSSHLTSPLLPDLVDDEAFGYLKGKRACWVRRHLPPGRVRQMGRRKQMKNNKVIFIRAVETSSEKIPQKKYRPPCESNSTPLGFRTHCLQSARSRTGFRAGVLTFTPHRPAFR
jgi:hypothetical protein